jgi:hypothetical protein
MGGWPIWICLSISHKSEIPDSHPRGCPTIHLSKSVFRIGWQRENLVCPSASPFGEAEYYRGFHYCQLPVVRFLRHFADRPITSANSRLGSDVIGISRLITFVRPPRRNERTRPDPNELLKCCVTATGGRCHRSPRFKHRSPASAEGMVNQTDKTIIPISTNQSIVWPIVSRLDHNRLDAPTNTSPCPARFAR